MPPKCSFSTLITGLNELMSFILSFMLLEKAGHRKVMKELKRTGANLGAQQEERFQFRKTCKLYKKFVLVHQKRNG